MKLLTESGFRVSGLRAILFPRDFLRKKGHVLAKGFSMVEMLVAIVIIGILATLIVASTNYLKKRAAKARSMNNLRQLATGVIGYTAENNGRFPTHLVRDPDGRTVPPTDPLQPGNSIFVYGVRGDGGFVQSWQDQIFSFVGSKDVFISPSMKIKSMPWPGYGLNSDLTGERKFYKNGSEDTLQAPRQISQIRSPERLVMMCELITSYNYLFGSLVKSAATSSWPEVFIYDNEGIFAFADGHIESINRKDKRASAGNHSSTYAVEFQ
ncbi:MAG: prepilin-type N-terminal cleavage/methylation domain-containing protein [Verrucomicrobiaceae bacterium]|nr:MAG: prepilin-type N-terminal cleavage/methylation domain-containing protein [Verrucomicrobiaceae bacterium]